MKVFVIPARHPAVVITEPAKRVAIPLPARFELDDPALEGLEVTGSLGFHSVTKTITVDEIRLHRLAVDGPSISADHIRAVSIGQIVDAVVAQLGRPFDPDTGVIDWSSSKDIEPDDIAALRGTRKRAEPRSRNQLQQIADLYNENPDHRPTMRVAEHFGWTRSTASRRIREARDAGLIEETP